MDHLKKSEETAVENRRAREDESAAPRAAEIRLLDDLELVLAGGGDMIPTWP